MFFFRFPPPQYKKRLRFLWGVSCFLSFFLNIQVKLHTLITFKQQPCSLQIILVYVYVSEIQSYVFQWQVYLPRHKIKVVYIGR